MSLDSLILATFPFPVSRTASILHISDYILITNLMHWLLFIHKILFSSTCLEHQVLIFRRT